MSRRTQQVSSLLERSIQDVISRGLHDPRISGLITVTGVDVPPDMSTAIVHFTVIPAEKESLVRHGLQDAAGFIRREVGEKVRMRRIPNLTFKVDEVAKEQASVLHAISKARAEFNDDDAASESETESETAESGKNWPDDAADGVDRETGDDS